MRLKWFRLLATAKKKERSEFGALLFCFLKPFHKRLMSISPWNKEPLVLKIKQKCDIIYYMSKNEKNYILTNYTSNRQAKLQLFCSQSKGINIFDKFCKSAAFNRPDMYFINNKICYMFEHFEIDASLYIDGKGSSYKRNIFIADKQLKKQANDLIKNSQIDKNEISSQGTTSLTTT